MLVLARKKNESVNMLLGEATLLKLLDIVRRTKQEVVITTTIVSINGRVARLGIDADPAIDVLRGELTRGDHVVHTGHADSAERKT